MNKSKSTNKKIQFNSIITQNIIIIFLLIYYSREEKKASIISFGKNELCVRFLPKINFLSQHTRWSIYNISKIFTFIIVGRIEKLSENRWRYYDSMAI